MDLSIINRAASLLDLSKYDEEITQLRDLADAGRLPGEETYRGAGLSQAAAHTSSAASPTAAAAAAAGARGGLLQANLSSIDLRDLVRRLRAGQRRARPGSAAATLGSTAAAAAEDLVLTPEELQEARAKLRSLRIRQFLLRGLKRFSKGFWLAFGAKSALEVLRLVLRLLRSRRGGLPKHWLTMVSGEATRYGFAMGMLLAIFESIMRLFRYSNRGGLPGGVSMNSPPGQHRVRYRALMAGAAAGLSLLLVPKGVRSGIALFCFVRAMETAIRVMGETGHLPWGPDSPFARYGEVFAMSLASAQVCWAAVYNRESLAPGYQGFMLKQSGKSALQLKAYSEATSGGDGLSPETAAEFARATGFSALAHAGPYGTSPASAPGFFSSACQLSHPDDPSCAGNSLRFLLAAIARSLPVYLPVYLIPMLVFRGPQLLRNPLGVLGRSGAGLLRSSIFLAVYCTTGWGSMCALRRLFPVDSVWLTFLGGATAGTSVLIEKPGRRTELAIYVMQQAIQSWLNILAARRLLPSFPHANVAVFSVAMAIFMHVWINYPFAMRPTYFGLFRLLWGSGGVVEDFPENQKNRSSLNLRALEKSSGRARPHRD